MLDSKKGEKPVEKPGEKNRADYEPLRARLTLDESRLFEYKSMIENLFRRYGPTKARVTLKSVEKAACPLMAGIDPESWDADFSIRSTLGFPDDPELLKYMDGRNITDPVKELLEKVAYHEIGHWEFPRGTRFGCPYDKITYYVSFIEPIYDEMKKSGKFKDDFCQMMSGRLANAVMDIIDNQNVNFILARNGDKYTGQMLFWYLQGKEPGAYSDEYTLFVRLNLALYGENDDLKLLTGFFAQNKDIIKSVSRLEDVFLPEMIYDRDSWEYLARAYTREAIKFIKAEESPKQQYSPDDRVPFPRRSKGSGKKGEEKGEGKGGGKSDDEEREKQKGGKKKDEEGEEGEAGDEGEEGKEKKESKPGKGKGKKENDEEEEGGSGKGEKGEEGEDGEGAGEEAPEIGSDLTPEDVEAIMGGRKAGRGVPFYLKTDEALDAYYKSQAKSIPMTVGGKIPSSDFPLIPLTREIFDPEVHSIEDAVTSKLHFNPEQRTLMPSIVKARWPVGIPVRKEKRNLPDFIFALIDTSGSMMGRGNRDVVPWGDESYYHYALLTFYGMLRFFELERVLHKIDVSAAIFSDVTLDKRGLQEVKQLLLNPATGGTRIDIKKVLALLEGKRNAVFPMISDGEIWNWAEVKDEFIEAARRNQFFMISIGRENQTARDLEGVKLPVFYVNDAKKIVDLAIDLTIRRYRASISDSMKGETGKHTRMFRTRTGFHRKSPR